MSSNALGVQTGMILPPGTQICPACGGKGVTLVITHKGSILLELVAQQPFGTATLGTYSNPGTMHIWLEDWLTHNTKNRVPENTKKTRGTAGADRATSWYNTNKIVKNLVRHGLLTRFTAVGTDDKNLIAYATPAMFENATRTNWVAQAMLVTEELKELADGLGVSDAVVGLGNDPADAEEEIDADEFFVDDEDEEEDA